MAKARFEFNGKVLEKNLKELPPNIESRITAVIDRGAAKGEAHLKNDAPWTDRTGAARAGLHAIADAPGGGTWEILMAHTVDYGIWLEIKNSGKYEVIIPTMIKTGHEIMEDLRGIL